MTRRDLSALWAALLALPLLLAGCEDPEDKIAFGAKNFTESRILAEMMAAMAEEQGLAVAGIVDYPDTPSIMAAIKAGDIDAYPDYNGTGLVMLGQNPIADGDEAQARVKELFEPLGLSWLERFGFANNYGLALRSDRARDLGVTRISDLAPLAGDLSIAIEDDFLSRPLDGMGPMTARYGFAFGEVEVVPLDERATLFDKALAGDVDVIEVYTTDGQIPEYNFTVLEDDLGFFPVYQAAPVVRSDSLARHQGLGPAITALGGRIDTALMQQLNERVEIEGRSSRAIARDALARLGLIDAGAVETQEPLLVAADVGLASSVEAAGTLRAVQRAFTGRDVRFQETTAPLDAVAAGAARLAFVGAEAFYDLSKPTPVRSAAFEAVAPAGQAIVHVVAARDGVAGLADAGTIATGPAGSASARIAGLLVDGLGLGATVAPTEGGIAETIEAVRGGAADAAVLLAPPGHPAVADALAAGGLALLPLEGWSQGSNLVRYPFLRPARIAGGTYRGQPAAVDTLRTQLVLAGPAPRPGDAIGDQGPGAVVAEAQPISASAVERLNAALARPEQIDPVVPISAALAPALPTPAAPMNPAADISILSLVLVIFLVWLAWLLVRPEYR